MKPKSATIEMLSRLHEDVRDVFETHVPEGYAKDDALDDLDSAFDSAREAVTEAVI